MQIDPAPPSRHVGAKQIDPAPPSRHASELGAMSRTEAVLKTVLWGASVDALVFSCRFSVFMTIASLFLVAFPTSEPWPDSIWILITGLFVTWQPSIDAGSAFKKLIERIAGSMVGDVLAFAWGTYLSALAVPKVKPCFSASFSLSKVSFTRTLPIVLGTATATGL
jgi:hypothetical protein